MKKILLLSLSLLLFTSCQSSKPEDYEHYYQKSFLTSEIIPLYDEEYNEIGAIAAGATVVLADFQQQEYFKLQDFPYYINCYDVGVAVDISEEISYPNYIPFTASIKTNEIYDIYTSDKEQLLTVNSTDTYSEIIIKEADYYTVRINESYYLIPTADIATVSTISEATEKVATEVPVFMYHFFYSKENRETPRDNNWLEVKQFEEQLKYLTENNYHILTMTELEHFLKEEVQLPLKSVLISIDDGDPSVYKYAYPLLEKYQVHATTFLVTSWYWWDIDNRTRDFIELQSHSHNMHKGGCNGKHGGLMLCIPFAEGVADLKTSQDYLYGAFVFCYPFGDVNEHAKEMLRTAGYRLAFTTKNGRVTPGMDLLELPRVRISNELSMKQFIDLLPK